MITSALDLVIVFCAAVGSMFVFLGFGLLRNPDMPTPHYFAWAVIGLGWPAALAWWRHTNQRIELNKVERAKIEAETAARLAALNPPALLEGDEEEPDHSPEWRVMAHRFFQWGLAYGFNIRELAVEGEPGCCIAWRGWFPMKNWLIEVGVLTGSGRDTHLHPDWNWARWVQERHALPYPTDVAPPEVLIPAVNTTRQQAGNTSTEEVLA